MGGDVLEAVTPDGFECGKNAAGRTMLTKPVASALPGWTFHRTNRIDSTSVSVHGPQDDDEATAAAEVDTRLVCRSVGSAAALQQPFAAISISKSPSDSRHKTTRCIAPCDSNAATAMQTSVFILLSRKVERTPGREQIASPMPSVYTTRPMGFRVIVRHFRQHSPFFVAFGGLYR